MRYTKEQKCFERITGINPGAWEPRMSDKHLRRLMAQYQAGEPLTIEKHSLPKIPVCFKIVDYGQDLEGGMYAIVVKKFKDGSRQAALATGAIDVQKPELWIPEITQWCPYIPLQRRLSIGEYQIVDGEKRTIIEATDANYFAEIAIFHGAHLSKAEIETVGQQIPDRYWIIPNALPAESILGASKSK